MAATAFYIICGNIEQYFTIHNDKNKITFHKLFNHDFYIKFQYDKKTFMYFYLPITMDDESSRFYTQNTLAVTPKSLKKNCNPRQ